MGNIPFLSNFQNGSQLVIGKIHLYIPLMLWILFIKVIVVMLAYSLTLTSNSMEVPSAPRNMTKT